MNTPSPYAVWHEIIRSHIRGMEIAANISRQAEEQMLSDQQNSHQKHTGNMIGTIDHQDAPTKKI